MSEQELREYHIERARAEFDCSYRAENQFAAEAHMRLAALHMERAGTVSVQEHDEGRAHYGGASAREVNTKGKRNRSPLPAADGSFPTPLQECEGALQA